MQDLSIDVKHMQIASGGYRYLLVITCDQTNFTIVTLLEVQMHNQWQKQ